MGTVCADRGVQGHTIAAGLTILPERVISLLGWGLFGGGVSQAERSLPHTSGDRRNLVAEKSVGSPFQSRRKRCQRGGRPEEISRTEG